MDNGKDLNKALEWFSKAEEANPKAYWVVHQKANCLAKLGRKKEAIDSANKSIELAKADEDDNYVKLNEKLILTLKREWLLMGCIFM
jgi:tetratricopeptide (TPR) repeat protein